MNQSKSKKLISPPASATIGDFATTIMSKKNLQLSKGKTVLNVKDIKKINVGEKEDLGQIEEINLP